MVAFDIREKFRLSWPLMVGR